MNNRRKLVIEFGIATLLLQMAFAQAPITPAGRVWRVGILPGGPLAPRKFQWDAFRQHMHELHYVEGRNVQYAFRAPDRKAHAMTRSPLIWCAWRSM